MLAVKMRSCWSRLLNQCDWYSCKKTACEDTDTQRECHVTMKAEIGAMQLQARRHQRLPATHEKLGRGKEG